MALVVQTSCFMTRRAKFASFAAVLAVVLLAPLVAVVAGCPTSHSAEATPAPAPVVVSPAEAAALVRAGADLRLLDFRKAEEIAASRVAGSVLLDTHAWLERSRQKGNGLDNPSAWADVFRDLGIGPQTRVLLVGGASPVGPSAVWFYLQRLGFPNASVVNGGFAALKEALPADLLVDGPLAAPAPAKKPFVPTSRPVFATSVDKAFVRAHLGEKGAILVDARRPAEFDGTEVMKGNPRGGHIPGSRNFPHATLLDEKGGFLAPNAIRAKLEAAGLKPSDRVVVYCQSGGRSSVATAALIAAGYRNVENYLGSFGEWSNDATCPVQAETPARSDAGTK